MLIGLEPDVRVGDWSMPWTARDGVGRLGPGIPKSDFWASAKEGIDQVGCVYTAQGFEFDYVGVIFGPDLVYRPMDGGWVGQRDQSHDRRLKSGVTDAEFTSYVKSVYRVLLTRGLRGCYVYFTDAPTRDFFLSRTERTAIAARLGGGGPCRLRRTTFRSRLSLGLGVGLSALSQIGPIARNGTSVSVVTCTRGLGN